MWLLLLTARAGARWCGRRRRTARWWARWASTRPGSSPSVFFVGSVLAGLGGALQIPREPANLELDLAVIADAFVVTVVGGLGSIGGAFLAAMLIGVAKAFCIGIGTVHWFGARDRLLQAHPGGRVPDHGGGAGGAALRPARQAAGRRSALRGRSGAAARRAVAGAFALVWLALLLAVPLLADRYVTILLTDIFCFALFAVSLHFIMGPAGMVSFGHAAYFGLGAYAAGLLLKRAGLPMEAALAAGAARRRRLRRGLRLVLRAALGRLPRHADARPSRRSAGRSSSSGTPSPAAATAWSASGRRPGSPARPPTTTWRSRSAAPASRCCGACCSRPSATRCAPAAIRRCAPRRSASTCARFQWMAFVLAGALAGLAGARLRLLQGQHLAARRSRSRSRPTALVMVLLGGVETLTGPVVGRGDLHLAARRGRPPHRILARASWAR